MCDALKELFALHYDEIVQEGRTEGEMRKLIDLICKKLRKGKTAEEIADILEEDPGEIKRICQIAAPFAPEYDSEKVFAAVMGAGSKLAVGKE